MKPLISCAQLFLVAMKHEIGHSLISTPQIHVVTRLFGMNNNIPIIVRCLGYTGN